jgi:hypothetical protein
MNNFQGFDNQNNGAGVGGVLAGLLAGCGTWIGLEILWWRLGWGPGHWSRSDIFHAYWLAFWSHLYPPYKGDLGTWGSFETWLRAQHQYDAFVASFWAPFLVGTTIGILVAAAVVRAINKKGAAVLRGGRLS